MKTYRDSARAGLEARLPPLETFPNQHRGYEIAIEMPEYTSICPKTSLPDFGTLTLQYMPERLCVELKSLKHYLLGYRNLGIFYENAVNRVLDDVVRAARPAWAVVTGRFNLRGGMRSTVVARYPRVKAARFGNCSGPPPTEPTPSPWGRASGIRPPRGGEFSVGGS